MHRVYDPSSQMYREMSAEEARREGDRLLAENKRFRAALEEIAEQDRTSNAQWSASAEQMQRVARWALAPE